MKSKNHLTAFVVTGTLLLPLGALAQSGTSSSTGSNTGTSTSQGQYQGSTTSPGYQSTDQRQSGVHASAMQGQNAKRVSEDQLKNKITAERLQGKKVVDRDGQKIGKVKHVGLTQALRQSDDTRSGASGSIGAGGMSASGSATSSIGQSGGSMGSTQTSGSAQANLYVELDDAVGVDGDDLASIPVSSVRFDQDSDEVKLQINRQELASQLRQDGQFSSATE